MFNDNMVINLYFVRHGMPDYEKDVLTAQGKREAEAASEVLKHIPFNVIYSSALGRAVETASFLANKISAPIIKMDWCREDLAWQNFGYFNERLNHEGWIFWNGPYLDKMKTLQEDPLWYQDPLFPSKIGEGIIRINNAVDEWLLSMNIKHDRKHKTFKAVGDVPNNIILFAHGGFGSAFFPSVMDMIYSYYASNYADFQLCSITQIEINLDNKTPAKIIRYNDVEHLK